MAAVVAVVAVVVDAVAQGLVLHAARPVVPERAPPTDLVPPRDHVPRATVRLRVAVARVAVVVVVVVVIATTSSPHRAPIWAVSVAGSRSAPVRDNRTRCAPASI